MLVKLTDDFWVDPRKVASIRYDWGKYGEHEMYANVSFYYSNSAHVDVVEISNERNDNPEKTGFTDQDVENFKRLARLRFDAIMNLIMGQGGCSCGSGGKCN
jgi:hypothetical protein